MDNASLQPLVSELVSKPGHEKVRTLLHKLLTDGLGAESTSIDFEKQVPEVRGRIDAPVVAAGIVPEEDATALLAMGVARVYAPNDFELNRIIADIVALVGEGSREAA